MRRGSELGPDGGDLESPHLRLANYPAPANPPVFPRLFSPLTPLLPIPTSATPVFLPIGAMMPLPARGTGQSPTRRLRRSPWTAPARKGAAVGIKLPPARMEAASPIRPHLQPDVLFKNLIATNFRLPSPAVVPWMPKTPGFSGSSP